MHNLERVQTFDQLKILADPRRLSILRQLMDSPATLSQLGKILGEHPAWIRHHLKVLEGAGLVELCEVKVSDRFIEKYYRSKANAYLFQQLLLPEKPGKQTVVLSGSHDLALELLSNSTYRDISIFSLNVGSLEGLVALREGMCNATGCHLYDNTSGDYNAPFVRHFFPDKSMVLLTIAHREQGLIVSPGNPHKIKSLEDLARPGLRFINRNRGSGTRLWLDEHLVRAGIDSQLVTGYEDEVCTHTAVATAIHQGLAGVGLGIRAAAASLDLGFVPLFHERYDLVMPQEQFQQKYLTPIFDTFFSGEFRHQVENLGGYDVSHLGDQIIL
jgi:putative molybdopterin biosynthesis protein